MKQFPSSYLQKLLNESINSSIYLPESDGSLVNLGSKSGACVSQNDKSTEPHRVSNDNEPAAIAVPNSDQSDLASLPLVKLPGNSTMARVVMESPEVTFGDGDPAFLDSQKTDNSENMDGMDAESVTKDTVTVIEQQLPVKEEEEMCDEDQEAEEQEGNEGDDKEEETDLGEEFSFQKLGYKPLDVQTFHKLRQIYGKEECEYCGRLFYSTVDFENHIRQHTGNVIPS